MFVKCFLQCVIGSRCLQTGRDALKAFDIVRVFLIFFRLTIVPFTLSFLYVPAIVVNNVVVNVVAVRTIFLYVFVTRRESVVQLMDVEVGARL